MPARMPKGTSTTRDASRSSVGADVAWAASCENQGSTRGSAVFCCGARERGGESAELVIDPSLPSQRDAGMQSPYCRNFCYLSPKSCQAGLKLAHCQRSIAMQIVCRIGSQQGDQQPSSSCRRQPHPWEKNDALAYSDNELRRHLASLQWLHLSTPHTAPLTWSILVRKCSTARAVSGSRKSHTGPVRAINRSSRSSPAPSK